MHRNVKNVPYYIFGKGSRAQLDDLLTVRRKAGGTGVVFFVDHFFQGKELIATLPVERGDCLLYVDTTNEPTTDYMDLLAAKVREAAGAPPPCCMVALGGGATMDSCKAVANLMTNPGLAEDYQGWELVKNPPIYKIAVPTLAGTGSECSRTCVLGNEKKRLKLGMNSDHTVFDQIIMDPELTRTVPREQFLHTGMDTYMHCFETLTGSYRNRIVDALAEKAVSMCESVFLSDDMMSEDNLEQMMIASYMGGMATGYVGVVHPFSAGLSVTLRMRHGIGNCCALTVLEDIYPEQYELFARMLERQKIVLPKGLCANLTDEQYESLYQGTIVHENSLSNRLGPDFKKILTKENVIERFKRM